MQDNDRFAIAVLTGGDDTLSFGLRLHQEGYPVVAIPKTMDKVPNGYWWITSMTSRLTVLRYTKSPANPCFCIKGLLKTDSLQTDPTTVRSLSSPPRIAGITGAFSAGDGIGNFVLIRAFKTCY
jgi:hypothetical protein